MQLALTQMLVNLFYHNLCAETNSLNKEDYAMSMNSEKEVIGDFRIEVIIFNNYKHKLKKLKSS